MATTGYAAAACVNWGQFTVPQLWEMVSGEEDPNTFQQVSAWQQTNVAIATHASALRKSRADLIASWPPERSDAAAAFVTHIDKLLAKLDFMAKVAGTNSEALHGIANALTTAKRKLWPIYDDWQNKVKAARNESTVGKALDTLTFWSDEEAWKDKLQNQASLVMADADAQVAQHRTAMQAPPPYGDVTPYNQSDLTSGFPPSTEGGSTGSSLGGRLVTAPAIPSPRSEPVVPGVAPTDHRDGIDLAGNPTTTEVVERGPRPTDAGPGRVVAPHGSGPVFAPGMPPVLIDGTLRGADRWMGQRSTWTTDSPAARAARLVGPGGVIGGPAGVGKANSDAVQARTGRVGGVLGDQHGVMPMTQAAGGVRRDDRRGSPARRHPDDVWTVTEGGPSVLRPGDEPRDHDPGPGVLGLDR